MSSSSTGGDFLVLCVCAGNIHRSPLAEALMQTWVQWYLPADAAARVRVQSAGLIAEPGAPMGVKARQIAAALGAPDRARTATMLTDELIATADIVLTATRRQADEVVARVPAALRNTFTMREAGRVSESLSAARDLAGGRTPGELRAFVAALADGRHRGAPDEDDVIDPQGRGLEAYLQMTQQEVPALAELAARLFGMPQADVTAYARATTDQATLRERMSAPVRGELR